MFSNFCLHYRFASCRWIPGLLPWLPANSSPMYSFHLWSIFSCSMSNVSSFASAFNTVHHNWLRLAYNFSHFIMHFCGFTFSIVQVFHIASRINCSFAFLHSWRTFLFNSLYASDYLRDFLHFSIRSSISSVIQSCFFVLGMIVNTSAAASLIALLSFSKSCCVPLFPSLVSAADR